MPLKVIVQSGVGVSVADHRADCTSCGRQFYGVPTDKSGDPCPATDHCPSYFEELGLPAPRC